MYIARHVTYVVVRAPLISTPFLLMVHKVNLPVTKGYRSRMRAALHISIRDLERI